MHAQGPKTAQSALMISLVHAYASGFALDLEQGRSRGPAEAILGTLQPAPPSDQNSRAEGSTVEGEGKSAAGSCSGSAAELTAGGEGLDWARNESEQEITQASPARSIRTCIATVNRWGRALPKTFVCEPAGDEWHQDDPKCAIDLDARATCLHHEAKYAEVGR
jgi:hypothetical protein